MGEEYRRPAGEMHDVAADHDHGSAALNLSEALLEGVFQDPVADAIAEMILESLTASAVPKARGIEDLVLSIIRERRMTCVIVTHNTAQAHRIADRTMILNAGKLVTIGPTHEVLRDR